MEKAYKTMAGAGAANIVVGIVLIVTWRPEFSRSFKELAF